LQLFWLCF
jgi:hypothetical protein